jgi:sugar phosphate isomerase/epimerase
MKTELDGKSRWHLSTIADKAADTARKLGLGLEVTEFCVASNMDQDFDTWQPVAKRNIQGIKQLVLHAPFSELCPAAIDPLVVDVTRRRLRQAYELACSLGISRMVVHSGFLPVVYDRGWFVERSVLFWKDFVNSIDGSFQLLLENAFEDGPGLTLNIVREVADPRMCLCLDVGHANTKTKNQPVEQWAEEMAGWLAHVHIHNNFGVEDSHYLPGIGSIDMPQLVERIFQLSPRATMTLECRDAQGAVDWLIAYGYADEYCAPGD